MSLTFSDDGGSQVLTITTNQTSYSSTTNNNWITITHNMNGRDTITVSENNTDASRTGTIIYTAGNADPFTVTVTQPAQDSLTVNPDSLSFDYTGTPIQTVTVNTSADSYTATGSDDWITIVQSDGSFTVSLSENGTGESRTGSITVNAGTANEVTINVTQSAQETLSVTPDTYTVAYNDLSEQTYTVTASNGSFTTSSDADWITITDGSGSFTVVANSNNTDTTSRTATITVSSGNADSVTVTFIQSPQASLDVTPTSLTFAYNDVDGQTVDVTSPTEIYTATPSEDWITVTSNPETQQLEVSVLDHDGEDIRNAVITVNDDLESEVEILVDQLCPPFTHKIEIDLSKDIMRFSPDSEWEVQTTEILTALDFDDLIVASDENWIFPEIANVSGKYYVKVNCIPNTKDNETGGEERTGYVSIKTFSGDGYPANLTIIQGKKW